MIFTKSTISVALSLLSLTTALPTTKSSLLTTRDDAQCQPGSTFYVCYLNKFRGCCSEDPCGLVAGCPPDSSPTPSPTPSPNPSPNPSPKPPTCKNGKATVYQPKMQTIHAGAESSSTPNIDLYKSTTEERSQTMTFTVPAGAKSCGVGWQQRAEGKFTAGNNARVDVWEGTNTDQNTIGSADFTNWPGAGGSQPHTVGPAECKEKMEFTTKLAVTVEQLKNMKHEEDKETHVSLEQNGETGWFIEYSC